MKARHSFYISFPISDSPTPDPNSKLPMTHDPYPLASDEAIGFHIPFPTQNSKLASLTPI